MASTPRRPDTPAESDLDLGAAPLDLTGAVFWGVVWKTGTRTVASVTRLVVLVLLARLLTPEDYGIAGMAIVVSSFLMVFADPALGAALVQRPTIDERDRSTVFWLAAAIGAILTVLGVAGAGLVADFFGEPEVESLFTVTSLCFVVASLSVVHRALLLRKLAYRSLEIREMIAVVTGGVAAVAVAVAGFGPWAVVSNFVAYWLVSSLLVWLLVEWRPRARFSRESARNLSGFSARILSATLLTWGNENVDKGLVGRFLGAASLGAYSLAYTAMTVPAVVLGQPLYQALAPAYSRIQHDRERLERAWLVSKRVSVAVVAPSLLALIVVAPDFVRVVLGEQWDDAIVPLQLLCIGGLANSVAALYWSVLQARGEASTLLRITIMSSAVTWAAFAVGLAWGIVGVAALYAVARWLLVCPITLLTTRALSFDFWAALRAGSELIPAALVAGALGFGARHLLLETGVPTAARLVLVAVAMLAAYAAIVLVLAPSVVQDVKRTIRRPGSSKLHDEPAKEPA
jgi:O-antigen/teichoic acid export membrane protein